MPEKIGGGKHLQPYDKDTGQYTKEEIGKIVECDDFNLFRVMVMGNDDDYIKFHFPIDGIHSKEYCQRFIDYIKSFKLYNELCIDDSKLKNHLFKQKEFDDKSNYMINILGFRNDEKGWRLARDTIIGSVDDDTMQFSRFSKGSCIITMLADIQDIDGNKRCIKTVWELKRDFGLRFITLRPWRK